MKGRCTEPIGELYFFRWFWQHFAPALLTIVPSDLNDSLWDNATVLAVHDEIKTKGVISECVLNLQRRIKESMFKVVRGWKLAQIVDCLLGCLHFSQNAAACWQVVCGVLRMLFGFEVAAVCAPQQESRKRTNV